MNNVTVSRRGLLAGAAGLIAAPRLGLASPAAPQRIVAIGSPITEIMFGLGCGDRIVAVDQASQFPRAARSKGDAGYPDDLSVDQMMSHRPDLVVVGQGAGPSEVLEALSRASVKVVALNPVRRREDIAERIRIVGEAVGEPRRGAMLADAVTDDLASIAQDVGRVAGRRRALILLGLGSGHPLIVGGAGTPSALALELAGADNAAAHLTGLKALKNERVAELLPEAIVALSMGAPLLAADVSAHPALKDAPATREDRVAVTDALTFTGFGPRCAHVIAAAAREIYPEAEIRALPPREWNHDDLAAL